MARGEDTRHHSNRKVGRSDLPRLSETISNHLSGAMDWYKEQYGEDAKDEFAMSFSLPSLINHPFGEPFSEMDASNALNTYRQRRNSGQIDSEDKELYGADIHEALGER